MRKHMPHPAWWALVRTCFGSCDASHSSNESAWYWSVGGLSYSQPLTHSEQTHAGLHSKQIHSIVKMEDVVIHEQHLQKPL